MGCGPQEAEGITGWEGEIGTCVLQTLIWEILVLHRFMEQFSPHDNLAS